MLICDEYDGTKDCKIDLNIAVTSVAKIGIQRFEIRQGKSKWIFEADHSNKWVEEITKIISK